MRLKTDIRLLASSLFFLGGSAHAMTGNEFLAQCGAFPSMTENDSGMCAGFVAGAYGGALAGAYITRLATAVEAVESGGAIAFIGDREKDIGICLPTGVNAIQLTAIFLKYLNERPKTWHNPAASILIHALRETYPCGE